MRCATPVCHNCVPHLTLARCTSPLYLPCTSPGPHLCILTSAPSPHFVYSIYNCVSTGYTSPVDIPHTSISPFIHLCLSCANSRRSPHEDGVTKPIACHPEPHPAIHGVVVKGSLRVHGQRLPFVFCGGVVLCCCCGDGGLWWPIWWRGVVSWCAGGVLVVWRSYTSAVLCYCFGGVW